MSDATVDVEWRRRPAAAVSDPLLRRVPYVECKLEHPDLDPAGFGERFFPDAVPYALAGGDRVFYWRPAIETAGSTGDSWLAACATTEGVVGLDSVPSRVPALAAAVPDGVAVVVDGTVGGESTRTVLEGYDPPSVGLASVDADAVELTVDGRTESVGAGDRRRIALAERRVDPVEGEPTVVEPELAVRYPGRRVLHHPAPDGAGRLFPSFGLDLDSLPRPLSVPTAAGELDDGALAERIGVDLADRPYPERVLWQAFAYEAFDPHADGVPALAQSRTGHLVLTAA